MFSHKIPISVERDPKTGRVPCLACTQCCHYVAIEIDTPEDRQDFDNIRWYLYHPGIEVYIDHEDTWNVLFHSRCENLLPDGKCAVYETRPTICREFDEEGCEPNTHEPAEKVLMRTAADLEQWLRLTRTDVKLAREDEKRERRRRRRAEAKARANQEAKLKSKARKNGKRLLAK
jgi:Fe-S-cluster containining protein